MRPDAKTQTELKAQFKVALQNQKTALKRFGEVMRGIPSGLPHPDGREQILKASREVTAAHESVLAILLEMNKHSPNKDGAKKRP